MNHKWKDIPSIEGVKEQQCTKCGIYRTWQWGDQQCWKYWYPGKSDVLDTMKTFKRPECHSKNIYNNFVPNPITERRF